MLLSQLSYLERAALTKDPVGGLKSPLKAATVELQATCALDR